MRRFIEEISVRDPEIASKIITALETKPVDKDPDRSTIRSIQPTYEVDVYEKGYDPCRGDNGGRSYEHVCILKIFVREDVG